MTLVIISLWSCIYTFAYLCAKNQHNMGMFSWKIFMTWHSVMQINLKLRWQPISLKHANNFMETLHLIKFKSNNQNIENDPPKTINTFTVLSAAICSSSSLSLWSFWKIIKVYNSCSAFLVKLWVERKCWHATWCIYGMLVSCRCVWHVVYSTNHIAPGVILFLQC